MGLQVAQLGLLKLAPLLVKSDRLCIVQFLPQRRVLKGLQGGLSVCELRLGVFELELVFLGEFGLSVLQNTNLGHLTRVLCCELFDLGLRVGKVFGYFAEAQFLVFEALSNGRLTLGRQKVDLLLEAGLFICVLLLTLLERLLELARFNLHPLNHRTQVGLLLPHRFLDLFTLKIVLGLHLLDLRLVVVLRLRQLLAPGVDRFGETLLRPTALLSVHLLQVG